MVNLQERNALTAAADSSIALNENPPDTFELMPVSPFRLNLAVWTLRRRPANLVDRWDGTTYRRLLPLPAGPVEMAVIQPNASVSSQLLVKLSGRPISAAIRAVATTTLERLLGLAIDLTDFYQVASHKPQLRHLAERFRGMKPPRFATVFESLINAIACQQMTLTLGIQLLNRLAVAYGAKLGEGGDVICAFPSPVDLACVTPADLRQFGFSRQKGRAMVELAQSVAEGKIDLEALAAMTDAEAVRRLCEIRGVGRWTAEYVLLRGLGRIHVFPGDDVGARNNLQRWLRLTKPLDYEGVQRIQSQWESYGGLVYFHLLLDRLAETGHLNEASGGLHTCDA